MKELRLRVENKIRKRAVIRLRELSVGFVILGASSWMGSAALAYGDTNQAASIDIENIFSPSGWMGDGEYGRKYIDFFGADASNPHSPPTSVKVVYRFGPAKWAGMYWLNWPDNWGEKPGNNYAGTNLSRLTFWARGETGNEMIEFKAGGIDNSSKQHRDSFRRTTGRVTLSTDWKQYEIDLSGADLSSVIGGFCWVASADFNSTEAITFYVDDIALE